MADEAAMHLVLSSTARQGYEVGLLSLLEVLDAQTASAQGLRAYIEAEADFHRARLQLCWAAGQPFESGIVIHGNRHDSAQ